MSHPLIGKHLARSLALHAVAGALVLGGVALTGRTRYYFVEAGPAVYAQSYAVGRRTELKRGRPGKPGSAGESARERPPEQGFGPPAAPDTALSQAAPDGASAAGGGEGGDGGQADRTVLSYLDAVRLRLELAKRYPPSARRLGLQGSARVEFTIAPDGAAGDVRLASVTGYSTLDDAALATVLRASPFPEPPGLKACRASADIVFRLK